MLSKQLVQNTLEIGECVQIRPFLHEHHYLPPAEMTGKPPQLKHDVGSRTEFKTFVPPNPIIRCEDHDRVAALACIHLELLDYSLSPPVWLLLEDDGGDTRDFIKDISQFPPILLLMGYNED